MQFMPYITAGVLAGFLSYVFSWYKGWIGGNFSLLLFIAFSITGVFWLLERFVFAPRRASAAQDLAQSASNHLSEESQTALLDAQASIQQQPWWLDWTAGLFPVIAAVFVLRSFMFEPFKIPSGSMIPTLHIGDLILVNKYTYGLRLPVLNTKLTDGNPVQRGDVVVFRYPPNTDLDYIKRVVGVPGDVVEYHNKQLKINGKEVVRKALPEFLEQDTAQQRYAKQFEEQLPISGSSAASFKSVKTLNYDERPPFVPGADDFALKSSCQYSATGVTCTVPVGHYFMMGDNRDNSLDSRYWGFVPDSNIVGKAFYVWMNFGNLSRIGAFE